MAASTAKLYNAVPAALPATLPAIDREAARRIATMIYRRFRSDRRYRFTDWEVRRVWLSKTPTLASNHSKGLGRLVHDLSHRIFRATYPNRRPHDPLHAKYETDVAAYVAGLAIVRTLANPPPPKPKKPAPTLEQKHAAELLKVEAAIKRWTTKAKRAETALRKLKRKQRRLLTALTH